MDSILYFGCFSSILFVGLFVWFYFQVELVCNCLCYFRAWFHMISLYGYLDMCIGYSWIRFFTFYLLVIHVHLQELGIFLYVLMNVQIRKLSLEYNFFHLFQISGRLFSDSGPRRSTRLAGEAGANANSSTTTVAGNGTINSSKYLGGSKLSSVALRSVTLRKGQSWANENIDEGDASSCVSITYGLVASL